jgi:hypothetical protein
MAETAQLGKNSWGQGQDKSGIARKKTVENRDCRGGNADDGEESGTDRDENDAKRCKSGLLHSKQILKWYACPFHKHDPTYFSSNKETRMRFKSCGAKGWIEISRLK